jgi:hypothetical protein
MPLTLIFLANPPILHDGLVFWGREPPPLVRYEFEQLSIISIPKLNMRGINSKA